jgi:hypothetical protein
MRQLWTNLHAAPWSADHLDQPRIDAMATAGTVAVLLPGATYTQPPPNAALRATGLTDRSTVAPGQRANLCLWRIGHPGELAYAVGLPRPSMRIVAGSPSPAGGRGPG